jgi:hypothetical protein
METMHFINNDFPTYPIEAFLFLDKLKKVPFKNENKEPALFEKLLLNKINTKHDFGLEEDIFLMMYMLQAPNILKLARQATRKTETHKKQKGGFHVVPRERYIRRKLVHFLANAAPTVQGYNGKAPQSGALPDQRTATYEAVIRLPMFSGCVPDMKNGHLTHNDQNSVKRCLTISDREAGIVGAIDFSINLKTKVCEVWALGVKESHQRKQFGAILLQCAVIVSRLYDCAKVTLYSVSSAEGFYRGQGLVKQHGMFALDFRDEASKAQFERKAQKTAPNFTLKSLIEKTAQIERKVLRLLK